MLFLESLLLISSKGRIFMQVIIYLPTGQSVGLINESHFAYLIPSSDRSLMAFFDHDDSRNNRVPFPLLFPVIILFSHPLLFYLDRKIKVQYLPTTGCIVQNSQPVSHSWISQPTKLICFKSGYFENNRPPSKMSFMDIVIETDCFFSFI